MSDSEASDHAPAAPKEEEGVPVPDGSVIVADTKEDVKETEPKVEPKVEDAGTNKPSFTLHLSNLPEDLDVSELEMRLVRFGEVVSLEKGDGMYVVKFSRTKQAYAAREKLNGADLNGSKLQVEFGPQDTEHYNRKGQKRTADRGKKDFADAEGEHSAEVAPPAPRGRGNLRAWGGDSKENQEPQQKRQRTAPSDGTQKDAGERSLGSLTTPAKPVSRWKESLKFEEQLEDFMKMPRRGMYNRYLVIGKLPPELRTSEAIWRMVAPVQRDIVQVEMLTCFGKPVAHVSLRNATSAATMHRLAEQMLPNLTVAFAPPRRASPTLWLGNIDDYVPRKDIEGLLETFGEVANPGMRYIPARTCAFATFLKAEDAVSARNTMYGMEILKNQYLNVDFTDESIDPPDQMGMWGQGPYGQRGPWMPPGMYGGGDPRASWGMYSNWYGGKDDRARPTNRDRRSPQRGQERDRGKRRDRSRTPTTKKQATSPERTRRRARESPVAQRKSSSPEGAPEVPKVKVKLYKMGEFCCNIVANFVKGNPAPESIGKKLQIDQRTKIDHCRSHMERAGELATVWHFSAADRKDCGAYDALCDYFVEKTRVGLVQSPTHYVYIVPPTDVYLKELQLPHSNFVVGIQIPIKK